MGENAEEVKLNLGCGFTKMVGYVNVDGFAVCKPDVLHDLTKLPYPWDDNSVDLIKAFHVMEHLENWWDAFSECVRITRPGGTIEVRVPHPSSDTALTYRDHLHVIDLRSFDGVQGGPKNTVNAWFEEQDKLPVELVGYHLVPFQEYQWMPNWLLNFVSAHMRNFIWEQRFLFTKIGD